MCDPWPDPGTDIPTLLSSCIWPSLKLSQVSPLTTLPQTPENHFVEGVRAARGWKAARLQQPLPADDMKLVMASLAVEGTTLMAEAPLVPTKKVSKARLPRPGLVMEPSRSFVPHEERMQALLGTSNAASAIVV